MSGAAGWPNLLADDDDDGDDDDDDDDGGALVGVGEWLESTSFTSSPEAPADTPRSSYVLPEEGQAAPGVLGGMPPQPSMAPQSSRETSPEK